MLLLLLAAGLYWISSPDRKTGRAEQPDPAADASPEEPEEEKEERIPVSVSGMDFKRVSPTEILISWEATADAEIEAYRLEKRQTAAGQGFGEWTEAGFLSADEDLQLTDQLNSPDPVLYEYRVMPEPADTEKYLPCEGETLLAGNVMICIDPGHYAGKNQVPGEDSYGYAEGDITLGLGQELQRILKKTYGIDSCLTRETPSITLSGYTDQKLDGGHISLRGQYAARLDCNLFVSLHTNSNRENANGCGTWEQPMEINKTEVIVNAAALKSDTALAAGNAVGVSVSAVNYERGLTRTAEFKTVSGNEITGWTDAYNDSTESLGTVLSRLRGGEDYYGVLRGASEVGIPGFIIEHGFHTVPALRREVMENALTEAWALADAYGIAYGFGFADKKNLGEE